MTLDVPEKREFSIVKGKKEGLTVRKMTKQQIKRTVDQYFGNTKEDRLLRPGEESLIMRGIKNYIEDNLFKNPNLIRNTI